MIKKTLPNGLTVVLSPLHETKTATVLVLVRVGSRYETRKINGVSHFLEHLLFKGTSKRPTTLDISKELDRIGASYNAYTSKDHTAYYVKASHEHVGLALDILSDMLRHSVFDAEEVERERGVVVEELNMYEDNPLMHIEEASEETLYGQNTPVGQLIGGPREVIRAVPRKAIMDFWKTYYQPANMVVAIAGHIDPGKTLLQVQKTFGYDGEKRTRATFLRQRTRAKKMVMRTLNRSDLQSQLGIAFASVGYGHKDLPALKLLNTILGASMSSRLFVEVREKRGLAYAVRSDLGVYEGMGHLYIQAGVDSKRFHDAVHAITAECKRLTMEPVTEEELRDAKEQIKGRMNLQLEDTEKIAAWFGTQEILMGQSVAPEERLKELRDVTMKDIQKVARNVFKSSLCAVTIIGKHSANDAARARKLLSELI